MQDPGPSKGNGADTDWPPAHSQRSLGQHATQIRHDAATLADEVRRTTTDLESYLADQVRRRPYGTLSVAAGVGYVLGGGLASRLTVVLLGVATRLATALAVREVGERILPHSSTSGHDGSAPSAARAQQRSDHED